MKKHSRTILTPKKGERYIRMAKPLARKKLDYVTATLPDGQEVDLYGDAVDIVAKRRDTDPEWISLANAIAHIATSEVAPWSLKSPVIDFLSSNSGDLWGKLMITPPMIIHILVAASCKQSHDEEEVGDAN